jgi:hypothetical protein
MRFGELWRHEFSINSRITYPIGSEPWTDLRDGETRCTSRFASVSFESQVLKSSGFAAVPASYGTWMPMD